VTPTTNSPPKDDRLVDTSSFGADRRRRRRPGPGRGARHLRVPVAGRGRGASGSREGDEHVTVTTKIELHADETTVGVTTSFLNPSRDHRLRVHFPLPEPTATSTSGSAFGSAERGLTAEGRSDEFGLPTFPARDFVVAGGSPSATPRCPGVRTDRRRKRRRSDARHDRVALDRDAFASRHDVPAGAGWAAHPPSRGYSSSGDASSARTPSRWATSTPGRCRRISSSPWSRRHRSAAAPVPTEGARSPLPEPS